MKIKPFIVLIFSMVMVSTTCQTKKFTPIDFAEDMIIFGNGGGFAGTVTEYCILKNGQCFLKKAFETEFIEIDSPEMQMVEQAFNNYHTLGLSDVKMKAPGNMYYFVKYGKKEKMYEHVWGAYGQDPPEKLKKYYEFLHNLVNPQPTH